MSRDIHRIIINEYESRQQAASYRQLLKREEVYKKIPRIEEIDNEIRLAGVKYNKAILLGIEPSDKAIKELLAKIERLNQEKKELLIKHSQRHRFCGNTDWHGKMLLLPPAIYQPSF